MRSVSRWSVQFFLCAPLLAAAPAIFGSADSGVNKGNGTLPVRMQGQLSSEYTGEVVEFESHIVSMTVREVTSTFTTKCNMRGAAVKSFAVNGVFTLDCSSFPEELPILEICSDDEASKIEIITGVMHGKPYRFVGKTSKVLGDVVGIVGTMEPGDWSFFLDIVPAPKGKDHP